MHDLLVHSRSTGTPTATRETIAADGHSSRRYRCGVGLGGHSHTPTVDVIDGDGFTVGLASRQRRVEARSWLWLLCWALSHVTALIVRVASSLLTVFQSFGGDVDCSTAAPDEGLRVRREQERRRQQVVGIGGWVADGGRCASEAALQADLVSAFGQWYSIVSRSVCLSVCLSLALSRSLSLSLARSLALLYRYSVLR